MPFQHSIKTFCNIFNDVFCYEKPLTVQKYYLCGIEMVEILASDQLQKLFGYNFAKGTSRELDYLNSEVVQQFLLKVSKVVKKNDSCNQDSIIYGQNAKKKQKKAGGGSQRSQGSVQESSFREESLVGLEYFFSNVMIKVFHVPIGFSMTEEELEDDGEAKSVTKSIEEANESSKGTFILMYFEKSTRKRTYAKTNNQKLRIKKVQDLKRNATETKSRMIEDSFYSRENKMRRFANYFVTLFNMSVISPFTQFIDSAALQELKNKVRDQMDDYAENQNGENIKDSHLEDELIISRSSDVNFVSLHDQMRELPPPANMLRTSLMGSPI
jgi:hypothetical protein